MQRYDSRNDNLKVYVNGLVDRAKAKVSVFDSIVQGGDGVWEGLRVYEGRKIFRLSRHLRRLRESAHALAFEAIPAEQEIRQAIHDTLEANGMSDDSHIRLTLTRGEKITSGMDPRLNQKGCTLIVLAEWKPPIYDHLNAGTGIRLITSSIRRNSPATLDSRIHHNNLLNNILAKVEANLAGVDDALMLDLDGFLAETNATNLFIVRQEELLTPFADACLPGITREVVIELAKSLKIPCRETRITTTDLYTAQEAFTTGTMGELSKVLEADGRTVGDGNTPVLEKLQKAFHDYTRANAEVII